MLRLCLFVLALMIGFSGNAEAKRHSHRGYHAHHHRIHHTRHVHRHHRYHHIKHTNHISNRHIRSVKPHLLVPELAHKVAEIETACNSKLISGWRFTFVAGTRRLSCHASGQAADMQGNPKCIYDHLKAWRGGYSIDYSRVNHVHISTCSQERGSHFAHHRSIRHMYAYVHHKHHKHHTKRINTFDLGHSLW